MRTVTFLSMVLPKAVTIRFPKSQRATLLSLAQGHGIPLQCDCTENGCGRCAVKVATVRPSGADVVNLGAAEKDTLWRAGRLTPEQYRADTLTARQPMWRLACQYVPADQDIWVAF